MIGALSSVGAMMGGGGGAADAPASAATPAPAAVGSVGGKTYPPDHLTIPLNQHNHIAHESTPILF